METDQKNLVWIEKSIVLIVVRWRIYFQSFNFLLRNIPGKQNIVADRMSCMYSLDSSSAFGISDQQQDYHEPEYYLS